MRNANTVRTVISSLSIRLHLLLAVANKNDNLWEAKAMLCSDVHPCLGIGACAVLQSSPIQSTFLHATKSSEHTCHLFLHSPWTAMLARHSEIVLRPSAAPLTCPSSPPPPPYPKAFNVTGASNVILAVGYTCTGSDCPSTATATEKDHKPLIVGLVVGVGGGLVVLGAVALLLMRSRRTAATRPVAISTGSTDSAVTAMQAAPESPAAASSDMMAAKATPPPAPIPFPALAPKVTVAVITPEPGFPLLATGAAAPVPAVGAGVWVQTPEPAMPVLTSEPAPEPAFLGQPEADSHATIPGNAN